MTNFPDDKELLDGFKNDETREKYYTLLVKKYQEKVYFHIRRMLVNHDDTNDVMQEVFIKIWRNLENFKENSSLFTWIYRIATNETMRFLEVQKQRVKSTSISAHEGYLSEKIKAEDNFDGSALEWKLQLAIQQLPDKQRLVFSLRYYDEMTYEEISNILGTSVGALKASFHHAVKKVEEFILAN